MTLLEVLIAMVIVAIGVLSVLQSFSASHRLLNRIFAQERLAAFSEGIFERIIASGQAPGSGVLDGKLAEPNDDISWTARFSRPAWNDTTVMVRIDLTVMSRDGDLAVSTERYWP